MTGVDIRPATPDEISLLGDIERAAGERFREVGLGAVADDDPPPVAVYAEAQRRGHLWVAVTDAAVVGYAWALDLDGHPHLEQLSVLPGYGGQGIGAALIDVVAGWAASTGGRHLTLSTFRHVRWNAPWYAKQGFAVVPDPDLDPQWRELRNHERQLGLDVEARVIMTRPLRPRQ